MNEARGPLVLLGESPFYLCPKYKGMAVKVHPIWVWVAVGAPKGAWREAGRRGWEAHQSGLACPQQGDDYRALTGSLLLPAPASILLAGVPIIQTRVAMATLVSIDRAFALPRGRAIPPGLPLIGCGD